MLSSYFLANQIHSFPKKELFYKFANGCWTLNSGCPRAWKNSGRGNKNAHKKTQKVDPEEKFLRRLFLTGALKSERGEMAKLPENREKAENVLFLEQEKSHLQRNFDARWEMNGREFLLLNFRDWDFFILKSLLFYIKSPFLCCSLRQFE